LKKTENMLKSVTILALLAYNILSPSKICISEKDLAAENKLFPREGYGNFQHDANPTTSKQDIDEMLPSEGDVQSHQDTNPTKSNQVSDDILPGKGDVQFPQDVITSPIIPDQISNERLPNEEDVKFHQNTNLTTPNQVSDEFVLGKGDVRFQQDASPIKQHQVSDEILPNKKDAKFQHELHEANPLTPNQVIDEILPINKNAQLQQKSNKTTPNQVSDRLLLCVKNNLEKRGWCTSKSVQKIGSEIQYNVKNRGDSIETFSISNSKVTGLCNINRSNSASFRNNKSLLAATFVVNDLHLEADYNVIFPDNGNAQSKIRSGVITEKVHKMFADMEVNVQDMKPQKIQSYSVRAGHDELVVKNYGCHKETNVGGNIVPLLLAGFKNSSRQILKDTMVKSMKIVFSQSIQNCNS